MATTVRISNIENTTTRDDLAGFIQSKGLPLAPSEQPLSLTSTQDGYKIATATFADNVTFQRALDLPLVDREINGRRINIDNDFEGFTTLSEGTEVDIIALHGLNGHAFGTWEYHDKQGGRFMWLRDSLPERIPGARVLIYGYNANVLSDVSTGRIRTFAETFLERLRHLREGSATQDRPLILIAHSMGGLIIKQALIIANARADKSFESILASVSGVMFLGTPHRGGNGVDSAAFVSNFMRAVGFDIRVDLIKSLKTNSVTLFDLTDDFRQLVEARGIAISTLFETKKTLIGHWPTKREFLVVDEQSAILGVARERKASVNANHSYLCKYKNSTDGSLVTVIQILKELGKAVVPILSTQNASTQPPPPEDLKYVCLADPDKLGDSPTYPILVLGQYSFWALSYVDNRLAMAILAYDKNRNLVGRWSRRGSRYVCRIDYDKETRQVSFIGQGNTSITFNLSELKVSGYAGDRG